MPRSERCNPSAVAAVAAASSEARKAGHRNGRSAATPRAAKDKARDSPADPTRAKARVRDRGIAAGARRRGVVAVAVVAAVLVAAGATTEVAYLPLFSSPSLKYLVP